MGSPGKRQATRQPSLGTARPIGLYGAAHNAESLRGRLCLDFQFWLLLPSEIQLPHPIGTVVSGLGQSVRDNADDRFVFIICC